jgi:hypothetical protein
MVIDDLNQFGTITPDKADAPLIVDPDAVLTATVASQCLEPISGRGSQVREAGCRAQHVELAQRHRSNRREIRNGLVSKESLGALALERPYHRSQVCRGTLYVKRFSGRLLRRLLQRADGGAHLHFVGVAPGDLGVGEEIAAAHGGVDPRVVDAGRHGAVLGEGAGGAQ